MTWSTVQGMSSPATASGYRLGGDDDSRVGRGRYKLGWRSALGAGVGIAGDRRMMRRSPWSWCCSVMRLRRRYPLRYRPTANQRPRPQYIINPHPPANPPSAARIPVPSCSLALFSLALRRSSHDPQAAIISSAICRTAPRAAPPPTGALPQPRPHPIPNHPRSLSLKHHCR